ncbi:MAG: sugar ABC transporter substrate-binding protein [Firmicutes bacterium]|nr:sugar ABC transporter substrate-binding protein [Bacillota bacterium]
MKKTSKTILFTLLLSLLFSGIAMSETTLEIWHRGDMAYNEAYNQIGKKFTEENPDIKVNFILYPKLEDKLITAGMADTLPDAWILDTVTTGKWVLNEFVSKVYKKQFSDKILDVCWETTRGLDGEYYGIPWSVQGMGIYYRQDWLDKLGLEFPKTWDELVEVTRQFTYGDPDGDGKDNTYGIGLYGASTRGYGYWTLQNFLWQAGGSIVKSLDNGKFVANLNNEETIKTLKFLHDLVYKHKVVPPGVSSVQSTEVYSSFQNGLVGMVFHGNYKNSTYADSLGRENVGTAIMPAGSEGSFALGEGENIYISRDTKNYKAIIKLAKFMTSLEIQKFGMQIKPSNPVRLSVRKDIDVIEVTEDSLNKPFQEAFLNGNIKYPENVPDYYPIKIIAAELMQEVFLTDKEPEYKKIVAEYNKKVNNEFKRQGILAED